MKVIVPDLAKNNYLLNSERFPTELIHLKIMNKINKKFYVRLCFCDKRGINFKAFIPSLQELPTYFQASDVLHLKPAMILKA